MDVTKIKAIVKDLIQNYDFEPMDHIDEADVRDCQDVDAVVELFRDANEDRQITDTEIIYYTTAMAYLKENDPSLTTSLGLAADYGFDLASLNSEKLASILASDNNLEDYSTFLEELEAALQE